MIIIRFPHFFGIRFPEWVGAMQAILVGLGLLHPYHAFDSQAFSVISFWPEEVWGILILTLGLARFTMLVINGRKQKITAWARLASAAVSCGLWTAFSIGLALSGVISTWWGAWPIAALVEFVNLYRAGYDARVAHGGSNK